MQRTSPQDMSPEHQKMSYEMRNDNLALAKWRWSDFLLLCCCCCTDTWPKSVSNCLDLQTKVHGRGAVKMGNSLKWSGDCTNGLWARGVKSLLPWSSWGCTGAEQGFQMVKKTLVRSLLAGSRRPFAPSPGDLLHPLLTTFRNFLLVDQESLQFKF